MTILLLPRAGNDTDEARDDASAVPDIGLWDLGYAFDIDGRDGPRVAIQMLRAGEINRREFFELCEEAAEAVG